MKVYLAARFGRQAEMRAVRDQLVAAGIVVTSRWIDVAAEPNGSPHRQLNDNPASFAHYALHDAQDLSDADLVISFTDGEVGARGGRHVEFGLALAWDKRLVLVGEREHVFHALPEVEHYPDWPALAQALKVPAGIGAAT